MLTAEAPVCWRCTMALVGDLGRQDTACAHLKDTMKYLAVHL